MAKQAKYKYQARPFNRHTSYVVYILICVWLLLLFLSFFIWQVGPVFLTLLLTGIALMVYRSKKSAINMILLQPSFVVVGNRLLYYRAIDQVLVDADKGICEFKASKETLFIERRLFTSNASKQWKIDKAKRERFVKVVGKVLAKVQSLNPDCQIQVKGNELKQFVSQGSNL